MEPRREEQKPKEPRPEEKLKRFRIVKLEDRIAPGCAAGGGGGGGGGTKGKQCDNVSLCGWGCTASGC